MPDPTITSIKGNVPVDGGFADITLTFDSGHSLACVASATVDLPDVPGVYEVEDIQVSGPHLLAALRVPFADALAGARRQSGSSA